MPNEDVQNIYGPNAVTGRPEANAEDPLKGRDVNITSTKTQTVKVDENDDNPDNKPNGSDKPDNQDKPDPDASIQTEVSKTIQADKDAKTTLESKGIVWADLEKEYGENGGFSEETYAKLEKAGFPRTVVDAYVAGLEAVSEKFVNTVVGYAGGKEQFVALTKFVASMGKAEVDAFNGLIEAGNLAQIRAAVEGYKARMVAKFGTRNPHILGDGSGASSGVQGYASKAEMVAAMSDKRYGRDKAYTQEVEAKVAASKFIRLR